MAGPRVGSLCTGYGGLDEAVQQVEGGELVWVADNDPGAEKILAHHHPGIPNLGDITAVGWASVPPVDILTMGFPCQDVSVAGLRAGLLIGNRSGLWHHCARAIQALNPSLVVIENVPGLLAARADGDVEPCAWCLGDGGGEPPLRALGAVLGDLAGLGFDAEWTSLPASDVGACHRRNRVFIRARDWKTGGKDGLHEALRLLPTPTPTATPYGNNQSPSPGAAVRPSLDSLVPKLLPTPRTSDANGGGQHGDGGLDLRTAVGSLAAADADGELGAERRDAASCEAPGGGTSAVDCGCDRASWGSYAPAIHRWESVTGRAAPAPVDERGRLAVPFVEWMQGLAAGHVADVPGMSRKAMLKALGNGVISQQAVAALLILRARAQAALGCAA